MEADRKDCRFWINWYCMKLRKNIILDESKKICKDCEFFEVRKIKDEKNKK